MGPEKFLDFLKKEGRLDSAAAERARSAMRSTGQPIEIVLTELGLLAEDAMAASQAQFSGRVLVDSRDFPDEPVLVEDLPQGFLRNAELVPLSLNEREIRLASPRMFMDDVVRSLAYFLGRRIELCIARRSEFDRASARLYGGPQSRDDGEASAVSVSALEDDIERLKDVAREAPIVRLVTRLVSTAVERGASDIHIEPLESEVRIRLRIDGVLVTTERLIKALQAGVISRVKILARMNIAERRLPQDGRIKLPVRGRDIDVRVSTAPALHGESVVLRILDRRDVDFSFAPLGFSLEASAQLERLIGHANGVVLVTGPTGSGKTTTLYAALNKLNVEDRKIFTVEDPIEYQLAGVSQLQVRPQIGFDFATALRAILRQDPDVIMVGEMRDAETARIGTQAALTGHLVLSTLHTNGAIAAVTRLIDMGVERYLLSPTLRGIVAQRLVRRLCPACKAEEQASEAVSRLAASLSADLLAQSRCWRAVGCPSCAGTGYSGRTSIYEIAALTEEIRDLIVARAPEARMEACAREQGMRSLLRCGLDKADAGETSLEEVLRATAGRD